MNVRIVSDGIISRVLVGGEQQPDGSWTGGEEIQGVTAVDWHVEARKPAVAKVTIARVKVDVAADADVEHRDLRESLEQMRRGEVHPAREVLGEEGMGTEPTSGLPVWLVVTLAVLLGLAGFYAIAGKAVGL